MKGLEQAQRGSPVYERTTKVGIRLRQLDSLRAFAVLAVLAHHLLPVSKFIPEDFLTLGLLGVRFFFTLSGFLITGILLRSQSISTFYLRRAMRIFPAYYVCLLIVFILGVENVRQYFLWHVSYLSNVLFAFHPGASNVTGHLWSLGVEEQFYLVWPWLILKVRWKRIWLLPTIAILFALIYKTVIAFTVGGHLAGALLPFGCLDSLGLGGLLACFSYDETLKRYRERFMQSSLIVGAFIVAAQFFFYLLNRGTRIFYATAYLGVSLIFTWLVGKAADGKLGKWTEARPLLYTGKISYGLYLWHNFMPPLVIWILGYVPSALQMAVAATVLTFVVAALSWKFLEGPLNSLKDRIGTRKVDTKMEAALEQTAGGI